MVPGRPTASASVNSKMCWAAAFQLRIVPSTSVDTIASFDDSTMAARRSRVSIAVRSRTSPARAASACSRSAMTAASARPDTASTMKSTSSSTAPTNGVLPANGPRPSAVDSVAMVAIMNTDIAAPAMPKSIAAHMTSGRTANARTWSRTGMSGRSPKTTRHAVTQIATSATSSTVRWRERPVNSVGSVNASGVTRRTPVLSPSQ